MAAPSRMPSASKGLEKEKEGVQGAEGAVAWEQSE
jgi:hypothetical protein